MKLGGKRQYLRKVHGGMTQEKLAGRTSTQISAGTDKTHGHLQARKQHSP